MRTREVSLTELMLLAATRGMLGAGIGLLVADRLGRRQRRTAGWVLTGVGALSTIPLALGILRRGDGSLRRPSLPFASLRQRRSWQATQLADIDADAVHGGPAH